MLAWQKKTTPNACYAKWDPIAGPVKIINTNKNEHNSELDTKQANFQG